MNLIIGWKKLEGESIKPYYLLTELRFVISL